MSRRSAASRTQMVKTALVDAGYSGRVTSSPINHTAYVTTVDECDDLDAVAVYLTGYLGADAEDVTCYDSGFAQIAWSTPHEYI